MKGYNEANGDNRGILERFLPTTYRTTKDGSNAHNAFLGSIKGSIETTRDDVQNISLQVYFTKATGKFLDIYGKYIGLSRAINEEDQSYRDRLVSYITTKRGTIDAIVSGIKNELNDKTIPVSVYETWRNIFILNQSTLNGLDYIMGEKYRYAVIEVTVGKYVDPNTLTDIVNRYKAYGVMVIYHYSLGISDNYYDSSVDFTNSVISDSGDSKLNDYTGLYFKNYGITLGDSPLSTSDLDLFKTNDSKLNSSDVLSGNPENAYVYDYTKSPSRHIIGYVPNSDKISNHTDAYGYIYDNNMVPPVGGRNLLLGTKYFNFASSIGANGPANFEVLNYDNGINMLHITAPINSGQYVGIFFPQNNSTKIQNGEKWSFSFDIKGTGDFTEIGVEGPSPWMHSSEIGEDWSRISSTNTASTGTNIVMYFDTSNKLLDVYIKLIKLETGTVSTDWTPAPEDNDHSFDVYRFNTEPYLVTSKKDSNSYQFSVPNGSSLIVGVDFSSYLRNNGYSEKVKSYVPTTVNAINIYTKGSEVGLPPTAIDYNDATGKQVSGSFSTGSTISDVYKSSGKYTYTLSSNSSISSVDVIDYYKYGENVRIVSLSSGGLELPLSITRNQVTGNIVSPNYSDMSKPTIVSYTNKFSIDIISNSSNFYVYNYTLEEWDEYSGDIYNIADYIQDASSINGSYLLIKIPGTSVSLNYLGININAVKI